MPFLAANLLRFNREGLEVMPMSAAIVAAMWMYYQGISIQLRSRETTDVVFLLRNTSVVRTY